MAEEIKFTDEEVTKIQNIQTQANEVFLNLGKLHLEKERRLAEINSQIKQIEERYKVLRKEEQTLFTEITEKYGEGSYDPRTGVFTPADDSEK